MPKAYSLDLRERVVRFVEAGHSRRAAAAHFSMSVCFVIILMRHYRARASLAAMPRGGRRHSKLDLHGAFLVGRVADENDIAMPELAAELFAATQVQVAPASISRRLIRHGFSSKKPCWPASRIAPTSARPARNSRPSGSRGWPRSRIDWCSSMRPPAPPRWCACTGAAAKAGACTQKRRSDTGRPRPSSPGFAVGA